MKLPNNCHEKFFSNEIEHYDSKQIIHRNRVRNIFSEGKMRSENCDDSSLNNKRNQMGLKK